MIDMTDETNQPRFDLTGEELHALEVDLMRTVDEFFRRRRVHPVHCVALLGAVTGRALFAAVKPEELPQSVSHVVGMLRARAFGSPCLPGEIEH
ncbi:MAG TPA: hypothetical protein ENK49_08560 [Gammaproteobacteria bacterium]|nr:hypothetical protein [Gammaproteobacteria bacterium]